MFLSDVMQIFRNMGWANRITMMRIGAVLPMDLVWSVTDLINALMVFPSCLALFALQKKIRI